MITYRPQAATVAQQDEIKALIRTARINPLGVDWRRFVVVPEENGRVIGWGKLSHIETDRGNWCLAQARCRTRFFSSSNTLSVMCCNGD